MHQVALRALGARIGRRVHIHRGVDLRQGGWDLLEIGDDATIEQDAELRLVDMDAGQWVVGPITIGRGATMDVRSGVGPGCVLEDEAYLAPLAALSAGARVPSGERWDGIPAEPAGAAPPRSIPSAGGGEWSPWLQGAVLTLARVALAALVLAPVDVALIIAAETTGTTANGALGWLFRTTWDWRTITALCAITVVSIPCTVALAALASRAMGRVRPGVISRWSPAYIRVLLKVDLVDVASAWLAGTLFWPAWLRAAGMRVGRDCEISTIIDVVPESVSIGDGTFLADGVYLNGPRVHRGSVTVADLRIGERVFVGNHAVLAGGQRVPDDVLVGVCTVLEGIAINAGSAWFGHPPFPLPRREVVPADRVVTHEPSLVRRANRVGWELLRFALPIPMIVLALEWIHVLEALQERMSGPVLLGVVVPLVTFAISRALVRVCRRAQVDAPRPGAPRAAPALVMLVVAGPPVRGVGLLRPGISRRSRERCCSHDLFCAMGARIGKRVLLGHSFAQVVDPDMLEFEDHATVEGQFQAHTFEDRVLKIEQGLDQAARHGGKWRRAPLRRRHRRGGARHGAQRRDEEGATARRTYVLGRSDAGGQPIMISGGGISPR